jgi:DNA polymerase III delta subunit
MAAPKGEKLLADAIRTGSFDPVYCLSGDNDFRKEEALRQLLNTAIDPATRDFNVDALRAPTPMHQRWRPRFRRCR